MLISLSTLTVDSNCPRLDCKDFSNKALPLLTEVHPGRRRFSRKRRLEGVLADVWPVGLLDETLTVEALVLFAWEWPLNWWKPLQDSDYAAHVSSADLLQLALGPVRQFVTVHRAG